MINLDGTKAYYISKSNQIIEANEKMALDNYGFIEMFTQSKLKGYKNRLREFYEWLRESDEAYAQNMRIPISINEILMVNGQLGIVQNARDLFVSSLNSYEKEVSNIEGNINFRLTTFIAILAIIISVVAIIRQ